MTPIVKTVTATRYNMPLRQGSSVPGLVEADDGELYVVKWFGAGQGPKALISELLGGEIARLLGLRVPELALVNIEQGFGRLEPHPEIHGLIAGSVGLNLGMRFLPRAFDFKPGLEPPPEPGFCSDVVWFDAYVTNIDRTDRNVNLLVWHGDVWLIDHGATLYFHHNWPNYMERSRTPFASIRDHTLLRFATDLAGAHERLAPGLTADALRAIVAQIPDSWLTDGPFESREEHREAYLAYLVSRRDAASTFLGEAIRAQRKA